MELLKNGLAKPAISRIASALQQTLNSFDRTRFMKEAMRGIDQLELKERVTHLIDVLHRHLPSNFQESAQILSRLPTAWDPGDPDDPLRVFAAWPVTDYVGVYGLDHPEIALDTLKQLTGLFSAEFAIRPFLLEHPEYCQQQLRLWVDDEDEHVRRLVSEGTRPRLPWGMQLKPYVKNPEPNLPLLEKLKDDSSLYVRRSVANHLNDIAKDHPDKVIEICKRWYPGANQDLRWVIKHATRTLVKQGHPEVFPLLGYSENINLKTPQIQLKKMAIKLGDSLEFSVDLQSTASKPQKMVVDFAVHFVKANGSQQPKVFKLKSITLAPGQTSTLSKAHPIRAITTRKYYSGTHILEILVNGKSLQSCEFDLQVSQ